MLCLILEQIKLIMIKGSLLFVFTLLCIGTFEAQILKPGFEKAEYIELLKMNGCQSDTIYPNATFRPANFDRIYRSPIVGLLNRWDLWVNHEHTIAGISIRATVGESLSWLGNFYSGMIPATDSILLNNGKTFNYKLSEDKKSAVHVGWTIGLGSMAGDILQKIDSCYKSGIKDFYIVGHSQGGAISYLLTAYVLLLQKDGKLPADIQFKTYCSAAPKPGNLFFAYNYEALTQGGWAFNVVNSEDWVPQMPVSVQTTDDFSVTNPFVNIIPMLKKKKFPIDIALISAYHDVDNALKKGRKKLQKYLGYRAGKIVLKSRPNLKTPEFYNSQNYVRTGTTIVLYPKEDYYTLFPEKNEENIFQHHMLEAYLYLAKQLAE